MLATRPLTRTSLAGYLPNSALSENSVRLTSHIRCSILSLPFDVHIDQIFIYLYVEDIICLRRVNKIFFLLTHEPIIWKRFLERINLPLPPLRPTFRYSLRRTDFEVEQLVTQAISLDDNWRRHHTAVRRRRIINCDQIIVSLQLLPGGKYLVASERDAKGYRYFLTIYTLDHPQGQMALARMETGTKAYHLQAKYMRYQGRQGIMIAFVRRRFKNRKRCGINPSDYAIDTTIDPPVPFTYECLCLHTPLDSLDFLADPYLPRGSPEYVKRASRLGPPFHTAAYIGTPQSIDCVTLFECNEWSYVSIVQQPDQIILKNMDKEINSTVICQDFPHYVNMPHRINAIRILPGQQDILVIRTVSLTDPAQQNAKFAYLLEVYDAPSKGGETAREAKETCLIEDKHIDNFQISDHGIPSTSSDHPTLHVSKEPPPPISIYARTVNPSGLVHYTVWPTHGERYLHDGTTQKHYYYSLNIVTIQSVHCSDPYTTHILSGTYRALVYTVPNNDRSDTPPLVSLRKYINPETRPIDYPPPGPDNGDIMRKPRKALPRYVYKSFQMPRLWSTKLRTGIAAITWDEGIGRVCLSAKNEKIIRILDFAHMVHPDSRFAAWKRQQSSLMTVR